MNLYVNCLFSLKRANSSKFSPRNRASTKLLYDSQTFGHSSLKSLAFNNTMEENNLFCHFIFAMVVLLIKGRLIFSNFTSIRYLFSLGSIYVHSQVLSCKTTNYFADCYSNLLWLCLGLDSSLECLNFKSSNLEIVLLYKLVPKSSWLDNIKISRILISILFLFSGQETNSSTTSTSTSTAIQLKKFKIF